MKKQQNTSKQITNRQARRDYTLDDSLVVGVVLSGAETKSLRRGMGQLRGSYVTLKDNELWLINATITGDRAIRIEETDKTRTRKLLAKSKEIEELAEAKNQGRTIVPLEFLTQGRYIKLRIAAGKGKKTYDKRETIKRRDEDRNTAREIARK